MRNGDRNTHFFHKTSSKRRRRNHVEKLTDSNRIVYDGVDSLLELASRYFASLFSSNGISNVDFILQGVNACIDDSMNEELLRPFTYEEVCVALKSMSPLKASGEDGLGAVFYQRFWHFIG